MVANSQDSIICTGIVQKKSVKRRIPLSNPWKTKYCEFSQDGLRIYQGKMKREVDSPAQRTVPICHIKTVERRCEEAGYCYWELGTQQGEQMYFRSKLTSPSTAWVAHIQIQIINYKNRQDVLRYRQHNHSVAVAENAIEHMRLASLQSTKNRGRYNTTICDDFTSQNNGGPKSEKTVILPNDRNNGIGIGITVISLPDGSVAVNRVLKGGAAAQIGGIRPRDHIISANGLQVSSVEMLSQVVRNSGESVTLVVRPCTNKTHHLHSTRSQSFQEDNYYPRKQRSIKIDQETKRIFEKGCEKKPSSFRSSLRR